MPPANARDALGAEAPTKPRPDDAPSDRAPSPPDDAASLAAGRESLRDREPLLRSGPVRRKDIVRWAIAQNPGIRALAEQAHAARAASDAESAWPAPEAEAQVWQVPLSRPWAWNESSMLSVGLRQTLPPWGWRAAKTRASRAEAQSMESMGADRRRDIARDVGHTFADLQEATRRHHIHVRHRDVARRLVDIASARLAAGGSLLDLAQAQMDERRLDADVLVEAASMTRARVRLNGWLGRPLDAPLGPLEDEPPCWVDRSPSALVTLARDHRQDLQAALHKTEAAHATAESARIEARSPTVTLGAMYFAPTQGGHGHGFGLSASSTLPWLASGADARFRSESHRERAAIEERADLDVRLGVDVAAAAAAVQASAQRFQSLSTTALPAARRAVDAALSSLPSGTVNLTALLATERALVELEVETVAAEAALDHALTDLDWSLGVPAPRTPLPLPAPSP